MHAPGAPTAPRGLPSNAPEVEDGPLEIYLRDADGTLHTVQRDVPIPAYVNRLGQPIPAHLAFRADTYLVPSRPGSVPYVKTDILQAVPDAWGLPLEVHYAIQETAVQGTFARLDALLTWVAFVARWHGADGVDGVVGNPADEFAADAWRSVRLVAPILAGLPWCFAGEAATFHRHLRPGPRQRARAAACARSIRRCQSALQRLVARHAEVLFEVAGADLAASALPLHRQFFHEHLLPLAGELAGARPCPGYRCPGPQLPLCGPDGVPLLG